MDNKELYFYKEAVYSRLRNIYPHICKRSTIPKPGPHFENFCDACYILKQLNEVEQEFKDRLFRYNFENKLHEDT